MKKNILPETMKLLTVQYYTDFHSMMSTVTNIAIIAIAVRRSGGVPLRRSPWPGAPQQKGRLRCLLPAKNLVSIAAKLQAEKQDFWLSS